MSPFQHGEVFVTEDGAETDLDIGHYERFIDENLSRNASHTAGRDLGRGAPQGAQGRVPRRDRAGDPAHHERDQGAHPARREGRSPADVVISEIGGTVGDIESLPFLEAIRQFRREVGPGERPLPARHARPVHRGRRRAEDEADAALGQRAAPHRYPPRRRRLPLDASRSPTTSARRSRSSRTSTRRAVIASPDVPDVYLVPERAAGGGARRARLREARARDAAPPTSASGSELIERIARAREEVEIALVGKYVKLHDAYLSVHEALKHAGVHHGCARPRALGRRRGHVLRGGGRASSSRSTACSSRAASARAAGRGRSSRAASRASARSRTSASASACTSRSPSSRATSPGWRAPTRPRWTPRRRTP